MKIKGLKKIAGDSKSLTGYYSPEYLQINFDRSTGEAWADYFYCIGQNSRKFYNDKNILYCGTISSPATMQQVREMIENSVIYANTNL